MAAKKKPCPAEEVHDEKTMQDHTDRFSSDQRLRSHGFQILARPKNGQPLWQKRGETYTEKEALGICERAEGSW